MIQESSKDTLLSIVGLLVILLAMIGVSFAYFYDNKDSNKINFIKLINPEINLIENKSINTISKLSTDLDALNSNSYSEFDIRYNFDNQKYKYSLIIKNNDIDNTIDYKKIKIALYDNLSSTYLISPTYLQTYLNLQKNNYSDLKIFEKVASGSNIDRYKLYVWIPTHDIEDNPISLLDTSLQNKVFNFKLSIESYYYK